MDMIAVVAPAPEDQAGMGQTSKRFCVEALVVKRVIDVLDEAILQLFAGCDIAPGNTAPILPFQDRPTRQFAATLTANGLRFAIEPDQTIQLTGDVLS